MLYMTIQTQSEWNSLEVIKILVGALTPVLILLLGILVHRFTKRIEYLQWRNQKLIEKRLSIYDDIAPLFNDLLCYFTYVGSWKTLTPPQVVEYKRLLDKKIYLASPLFSKAFFPSCMELMQLCYQTYTGWCEDAKLRTNYERRKEAADKSWKPDWDNCFRDDITDPKLIQQAYQQIMKVFADDIGLSDSPKSFPTGRVPANIK